MADSNQGFAAVVAAIERLRETAYSNTGLRVSISRGRLLEERKQTEEIKKLAGDNRKAQRQKEVTQRNKKGQFVSADTAEKRERAEKQPRDRRGRFTGDSIREEIESFVVEIKNLSIWGENVTLLADKLSLIGGGGEKSNDLRLAKAIAAEIRSKPLQIKTSLMDKLGAGFAFAFSQQFSKGFGRGTKKNTGINTEDIGYGIGNFATNPKGAAKDVVSWRRKLELDNSLAMAQKQALEEDVSIKEGKEKVFVVGGTVGKKGEGGGYAKRALQNAGFKQADIEVVDNPYTDSDYAPSDKSNYQMSTYQKHLQNKVIRGYNPDSVKLAAKVIAAKKKDKNAKISLVGHSGGSDVVEEAIAILERGGYNDVRGIGAGAMEMGVGYGTKGYKPMLGDKDLYNKVPVMGELLEPNTSNFRGFSNLDNHHFDDYIAHPDFVKNISTELQPGVVTKLLEQHYKAIIEKSAKEFEEAIGSLPQSPQFFPIAEQLQKDYFNFLQDTIKDAEVFAGEFNQSFSEDQNAPINAMLEKYQAVKDQIGQAGKPLKLSAAIDTSQSTPVAESESIIDVSPLTQAIANLRVEFDGLATAIAGIRVLIEGTTPPEPPTQPNQATGETPPEMPQTTAGKYGNYLQGIIAEARQTAEDSIRALIPNFKSLGIQQKRDAAAGYNKGLQAQVKEYRKAVKAGDLALASELGEKLLADAQTVGKVYDDILAAVPNDYVGTKSLQTQRGQVTRIQNEVLTGDKGAGRSPVGLPDLVASVEEMAGAGDNTAQGYLDALLARIGDAGQGGEAIGEATLGGLDQALDMRSPSKEMEHRGEMAGEGFEIGLVQSLRQAGKAAKAEINKLLKTDFFHGTSKAGAESILTDGVDVNRSKSGMFGQGFYLTSDREEAEGYGEEVLKAKVNVKNPLVTTFKEFSEYIKNAQKSGRIVHQPFDADNEEEFAAHYKRFGQQKTNVIKEDGYDSVFVKDKGYAVVFEAQQVAFENAINGIVSPLRDAGSAISDEINKLKATIDKDLEYLRAIATGDTAKAQAMVGDAAKGAGYGKRKWYHASKEGADFTEFDKSYIRDLGFHFGTKSQSKEFGDPKPYFVNQGKSLEVRDLNDWQTETVAFELQNKGVETPSLDKAKKSLSSSEYDAINEKRDEEWLFGKKAKGETSDTVYLQDKKTYEQTSSTVGDLLSKKYLVDESIRQDIQSAGHQSISYSNRFEGKKPQKSLMVFNPNQIKSAKPLTKTNDGKPVPLSARFDDTVADIRGNVNDIFAGLKSQAGEALQPLIAELETQFAAMGDNSINSLINSLEGLMGQLRGTGGDVGDSLKDGVDDSLDMHSPSEEMRKRGAWSMEGFANGIKEGASGVQSAFNSVLDWLENIPILGSLVKMGRGAATAIAGFFRPNQKATPKPQQPAATLEQQGQKIIQDFIDDLERIEKPLEEFEKRIRNFPIELGGIFDQSGKFVKGYVGSQMGLEIPDQDVPLLKGNVFTHNHPSYKTYNRGDGHINVMMPTTKEFDYQATPRPQISGGSFSPLDANLASAGQVAEVRAVSSTHDYSLKPDNQAFNPESNQRFATAYQEFYDFWENVRGQALNDFAASYEDVFAKVDEESPVKSQEPLLNRAVLAQLDFETVTHSSGIHLANAHASKAAGYKYQSKPIDPEYAETGLNIARGLVQGARSQFKGLDQVGIDMSYRVVNAVQEYLGIQSPSKKFEEIGENSGKGFEIGLVQSLRAAGDAVSTEVEKILEKTGKKKLESGKHFEAWQDDFTTFIFEPGTDKITEELSKSDLSNKYSFKKSDKSKPYLPIDDHLTFQDAVKHFQYAGATGKSVHKTNDIETLRAKAVVQKLIGKYGENLDVYRGFSGDLPLSEHNILYGSRDKDVASFYGNVKKLNVKGVKTRSTLKSVTGNDAKLDDEVVFLPENINSIEGKLTDDIQKALVGLKSQAGEALQPLIAELETQFAAMGDNSINSLINSLEGLMGQLRGTGESVGDELAEGTEDALKIKSPSKVFAAIGASIIAGLEQGLTGFEGTLEEKRKLLETYVKSVIELIYDFKKVTGEAETPAQEVRKLFQEIGKTGNATPEQLDQAKGYFPQLVISPEVPSNDAGYRQEGNQMLLGQAFVKGQPNNKTVGDMAGVFSHEYTHALQSGFDKNQDEVDSRALTTKGKKLSGDPAVANGAKASAKRFLSQVSRFRLKLRKQLWDLVYRQETEAYANQFSVNEQVEERGFFKADAADKVPEYKAINSQLKAIGGNVTDSLTQSIAGDLGDVKDSGMAIGKALSQGTEDALDIDSPSKVYKAIGQNIIAGLEGGLEGFEGTLEEKRKLLETYVKSVIELVYDFKKVMGEAETPAQEVRKLFQEIGKTGTATPEQLEQAKGYFPPLGAETAKRNSSASYDMRKNTIFTREVASIRDFVHEYTHALQFDLKGLPLNQEEFTVDELTRFSSALSPSGRKELKKTPLPPRIAGGVKESADYYVSQFPGAPPSDRGKFRAFAESIESEAYANAEGIESNFNRRKGLRFSKRPFFKADAETVAPQIKQQKIRNRIQKQFDNVTENVPGKGSLRDVFDFAMLGYDTDKKSLDASGLELAKKALSTKELEDFMKAISKVGINITDSLTQSIEGDLGDVKDSGMAIGKALSQGTEDALDIDSPSKVYKAIGKNIIAGLMQGMDGFEGTLEEKEKILETYVKSVIELIYSFKKVTGKPMGEADAVRKLFQEIGKEGTATPAQLEKAQKYFPQVERLPDESPGVALYNPKQNKIKIKQGRGGDLLSADLMHEYTHAMQSRFGVGMRFATTPADYFPKTAMSPKGAKHLGDRRVDEASDASANHLMGAFNITPEQGRRYETQFSHVKRRESEAYANELGVGGEQQRRGFFKADADKIAAQIKAAREETKKAAAELKQAAEQQAKSVKEAGAKVGQAFADGIEEGKQTIGDRLNGFLNWLEGIPIIGQLVKWGRQLAGFIGGLFNKKETAKPKPTTKPTAPKPQPVHTAIPDPWEDGPKVTTTQPVKPAEVKIDPVEVAEQIEEIIEPVTQIEVQPETTPTPTPIEVAPVEVAQEIQEAIAVAIDPQRQADRWLAYISQWAKNLGKTFDDSIGAEITELKASGKNVAQELRVKIDRVGNGLEQRQKQFRQAIADGNAQVAKAVGTELVEQSEQLRILYKRMAENVKFFEGRGMWRDQAAEMTKVQKEAVKGYPNLKGKAKTGAWQAIATNTADGFTQGMEKELSDAEQSGYDLGEAAIAGAKKALGIKSPSTEFLEIARNVVDGWNNGLDALGDDAANNVRRFMRSISDGTDQAIQEIDQGIGQIFTTIGNAFPILKTFKGAILAIGAGFLIDAALGAIVDNFTQFAVGTFDSVVAAESLTRSFLSLTGSSGKARQSMAYAAETAQKLGIDLKTAEDAYKGMMATTRGSALEGLQTDQIFESFSATAAARGLNNEEQGRMFAAIQQMLSKNKLSAEEVRQQLGEIAALDFQGTLARSMGVSVAQLDEAMSSGSLMAADVLPKVAAQYAAENAIVANSSETTAQAMTRYSNAWELLRRSFGEWFAEAKFLFSAAATGIELLTKVMPALIQWVSALALVLAWNSLSLFSALMKIPFVSKIAAIALRELGKAIGFIMSGPGLKMLATYAAQIILIQFAFDAWGAVLNVTRNRFTEYAKAMETTRKAVEAMEAAQAKLNKTQSQAGKNLPTNAKDIVTDQTWKFFGIETGLNLEPVRQLDRWLTPEPYKKNVTTLGEKQMNDFKIMASEDSQQVNKVLNEGSQVTKEVEKITEIDRQLAIVRSRRFENIRGDKQAYEESVAAEKELLAKREEVLAYTSTYQQSLDSAITSVEQRLADVEAMKARGGITDKEAEYQTTMAEAELSDLKKARTEFEKLSNSLTQAVNGLEREMRNLNEQAAAFNESLERTATNNRVAFLRQAAASGTGSTIRGMGLSILSDQDNQSRAGFLRDRLSTQEMLLSDPEFAAIADELRQQAAALGTDLENTATLDRIIAENRDGTTNQVAQLIKEILDTKTQLGQAEEAIAQSLVDQGDALFDLNRTIADFFQQLTQQFEEARIELDRVKNQLKYGGLKQKLQKALVPGSNSFINGIIGSIQGIFDQASSVMESVLGQRSARLSFAGEKYSLDNQMTDFARSVNGATQAVEAFRASLAGGQSTLNNAGQSGAVATNRGGGVIGALNRPNTIQKTFNQNDFKQTSGFVFPVPGGKITGDQGDGHRGLDVFAPVGTPILASLPGTIVQAMKGGTVNTEDSNPGKPGYQAQHSVKVKLDTPIQFNGKTINYYWNTHLTSMAPGIQVGARVNAGDKLGEVGMAGGAPHLHQAFSPVESFRGNTPLSNKESLALYTAIKQSGGATPRTQLASNANTGGGIFNNPIVKKIYDAAVAKGVDPWLMIAKAARETGGDDPMAIKHINPKTGKVISSNPSPGRFDVGVGQVSPAVAKDLGYSDKDRFDLDKNIDMMIGYFIQQMNAVGGDARKALAAYNAGLAGMRRGGGFGYADIIMQNRSRIAQSSPVATNVSYSQPQQQQAIVAATPDPAIARAQALTGRLTGVKSAIVDGNGQLVKQQIDGLLLEIKQQGPALQRQLDDATRMADNTIADSRNAFADLMQQYSPQTLDSQTAAEVRQANNTLRQQFNELFERRREQEDVLKEAKETISGLQEAIAELENRANDVAPEQAVIDRAQIDLLKSAIPTLQNEVIPAYEKALAVTKEQEKELNTLKTAMDAWLVTQAKQRKLDQDGEMIALRLAVAQASYNEQLKLQKDLETADNEYEKRKLQEEQRLINQPELLKEVLALLEKERDLKKETLQYEFDSLIRGRELEAVGRKLGLAQSEFNSEKILSLEIAQAELEAENNRLKILREVTDESEKARQLELTDAEKLQKIRQSELDNINRILDRKQGDRDLDSRQAENAANLSRNPFAATQLRENNAIANRQLEFERRAEEIRQNQPADRAAAMIAQESEILAQDLELIDREFRDLSETIGDNLGNAFNSFTDALISGDNALQAFTNALLKSVSDIGSQLMQQGMQGLMQNIFGKSGAIGGLFGGGGNPVASVGSILPGMITPFMGPKLFADGGYTGDGGKYEAKGIVHGGEFVINKNATRKIGLPALMSANTLGQLPGYATGGYVGSVESRLLSGLNSTRVPSISLPTENRRSPVAAGPVSNTVNVNINDRESRFYKQSRTLARELADELRG